VARRIVDSTLKCAHDLRNLLPLVDEEWLARTCQKTVGIKPRGSRFGRPVETCGFHAIASRGGGFAGRTWPCQQYSGRLCENLGNGSLCQSFQIAHGASLSFSHYVVYLFHTMQSIVFTACCLPIWGRELQNIIGCGSQWTGRGCRV
jgi:hypothetical protein